MLSKIEYPNCFKLQLRHKEFDIPSKFKGLFYVKEDIYFQLLYHPSHTYMVQSKVDELVLCAFIKYWVEEKEPQITYENYYQFYQIGQEFDLMQTILDQAKNNFDECQQNLYILKYFKETDTNSIEQKIASNLDKYIERYGDELMSLEISILYNIFNSENKKLSKQNEAYELIKKHYLKNKNDDIFILISCLDGKSLNESNLKDSILEAKKRMGFHPEIDISFFNSIFNEIEKVKEINNQQNQQIIKFEEVINEQRRLLDEQNRKIDELKQQQAVQIKEINEKFEKMMFEQKEKIDENKKIIEENQKQAVQIKEIDEKFEKIFRSQNEKIEEINLLEKSNLEKQQINDKNIDYNKEKQIVLYKEIPYLNNSNKGIIDYFKNNSNIDDEIKITASSVFDESIILKNLFDIENNKSVYTKEESNSWFCFEFQKRRVIISNYLMKSNCTRPNMWHPKCWVLEGSNDNVKWLKIDEQNNCSVLNGKLKSHVFTIQNHESESSKAFKYIRIRQTSVNWANNNSLDFCSIEFFGKIVQI